MTCLSGVEESQKRLRQEKLTLQLILVHCFIHSEAELLQSSSVYSAVNTNICEMSHTPSRSLLDGYIDKYSIKIYCRHP